jgi:hypothetical protein
MWHGSHNHSHFAKHFTKWLQLHQISHFTRVATATAVLATAEALPKGPLEAFDKSTYVHTLVVCLVAERVAPTHVLVITPTLAVFGCERIEKVGVNLSHVWMDVQDWNLWIWSPSTQMVILPPRVYIR